MIIALTGYPASGKSTVRKMFAECGYFMIDCDTIAHDELENVRPELEDQLGIPNDGNPIDRKALADIVFRDDIKLLMLENLIHPRVIAEIVRRSEGHEKVIVEVPIMKLRYYDYFDKIVVVKAPFEDRLKRAESRGWSREELERRDRCFTNQCGIEIWNDETLEALKAKVEDIV